MDISGDGQEEVNEFITFLGIIRIALIVLLASTIIGLITFAIFTAINLF